MTLRTARLGHRIKTFVRAQLMGPQILAFLPALTLAAYMVGGQTALLLMALIVPGLFAFGGIFGREANRRTEDIDGITNLPHRMSVVNGLDRALPNAMAQGRAAAALAAKVDNFSDAIRDLSEEQQRALMVAIADRIKSTLRDCDVVARLDGARFVAALTDLRRADHEMMVEVAKRMQAAIAEPISLSGQRVHLTLSVGFCLPGKLSQATGDTMVEAADAALAAARSQGAGGIRSFDSAMPVVADTDKMAVEELVQAMDAGQIKPWFQPQVSAKTGEIVGIEALARWDHPKRGIVMPSDFLPLIEPAGLSRRLGEVMLYGAFSLLRNLDRQNQSIPRVSVNFSHTELSAPDLADRIKWELDRFDLSPDRLAIEVLETAIARDTTTVERNLGALAKLGCKIDLDDFGTGNTSIAGIRRFAVSRLKIDRSFVTRVDRDPEQTAMVRAIQTMARQLGIETVAEGVETVAEHAAIAELGCDFVQGFAIARPMVAEEVGTWIEAQHRKLGMSQPVSLENRSNLRVKQGKTA